MGKSAKQIIKDLAQDVETAASEVVAKVGEVYTGFRPPLAPDGLPDAVREAYAAYHAAVARLQRATTTGGAA